MADDPKKLLEILSARVRQLMFLCVNHEEEIAELKKKLEAKETMIQDLTKERDEIYTKYRNLKTARAFAQNSSDTKEEKSRLNKLVREIDKCIALLNQ